METTNNIQQDEEISLKEVILKLREWYRYLLGKWKTIALAGLVGGILGFTYAYFKKPVYTAECTFVLEEGGGSGALGQYAGLASMVGIDLGGGGGNGIFQGDNIIQLYKSRTMIEKTLLSPVVLDGKKQLLIDRFIESNKSRDDWKENETIAKIAFSIPKEKYSLQHDSIIGEMVKDINKRYLTVEKPDKKLSIISVRVKAKDELFAREFTDKIVENVNEFYVQTKTKKSFQNVQLLQKQADSVRRVLNASIGGAASAVDANPNANAALQMLRVPSQRRQIDVQASSAIYAEVVKNLEIARISLRRETPLIQVIDRPVLPLFKDRIGRGTAAIIGAFLSIFLVALVLGVRRYFKTTINNGGQ